MVEGWPDYLTGSGEVLHSFDLTLTSGEGRGGAQQSQNFAYF
jgi:hypothetical protein